MRMQVSPFQESLLGAECQTTFDSLDFPILLLRRTRPTVASATQFNMEPPCEHTSSAKDSRLEGFWFYPQGARRLSDRKLFHIIEVQGPADACRNVRETL